MSSARFWTLNWLLLQGVLAYILVSEFNIIAAATNTTTNCSAQVVASLCVIQSGCVWSAGSGACQASPVAPGCDTLTTFDACTANPGCGWSPITLVCSSLFTSTPAYTSSAPTRIPAEEEVTAPPAPLDDETLYTIICIPLGLLVLIGIITVLWDCNRTPYGRFLWHRSLVRAHRKRLAALADLENSGSRNSSGGDQVPQVQETAMHTAMHGVRIPVHDEKHGADDAQELEWDASEARGPPHSDLPSSPMMPQEPQRRQRVRVGDRIYYAAPAKGAGGYNDEAMGSGPLALVLANGHTVPLWPDEGEHVERSSDAMMPVYGIDGRALRSIEVNPGFCDTPRRSRLSDMRDGSDTSNLDLVMACESESSSQDEERFAVGFDYAAVSPAAAPSGAPSPTAIAAAAALEAELDSAARAGAGSPGPPLPPRPDHLLLPEELSQRRALSRAISAHSKLIAGDGGAMLPDPPPRLNRPHSDTALLAETRLDAGAGLGAREPDYVLPAVLRESMALQAFAAAEPDPSAPSAPQENEEGGEEEATADAHTSAAAATVEHVSGSTRDEADYLLVHRSTTAAPVHSLPTRRALDHEAGNDPLAGNPFLSPDGPSAPPLETRSLPRLTPIASSVPPATPRILVLGPEATETSTDSRAARPIALRLDRGSTLLDESCSDALMAAETAAPNSVAMTSNTPSEENNSQALALFSDAYVDALLERVCTSAAELASFPVNHTGCATVDGEAKKALQEEKLPMEEQPKDSVKRGSLARTAVI